MQLGTPIVAVPSFEMEFLLKVVDARLTLVHGVGGKVDQLVLHPGGRMWRRGGD